MACEAPVVSATLPKTLCRSFLGPRMWGMAAWIVLDVKWHRIKWIV